MVTSNPSKTTYFTLIAVNLIAGALSSSLGEKPTNPVYDGLCWTGDNKDNGTCWCISSQTINISCSNINQFETFTLSINQAPRQLKSTKVSLRVDGSEAIIGDIIAWLENGSSGEEIFSFLDKLHLPSNGLDSVDMNWFNGLNNLESLDLSNNLIATITWSSLKSLQSLDLSHNRLTFLNLGDVRRSSPHLARLDVSSNLLKSLQGLSELPLFVKLSSLSIHDNPWDCNESVQELGEIILKDKDKEKGPNIIKQSYGIICAEPSRWREMSIEQVHSVLQTNICKECDCLMTKRDALTVNCSFRELTSLPQKLPLNTRIVLLTGNRIKSFYLPAGPLTASWHAVRSLYLDNNEIDGLQDLEINKIIRSLLSINLQGNRMKEVPVHILEQFTHLLKINLSDNPWTCDCNTLTFQKWLQKHHEKIPDINKLYCSNMNNRIAYFISSTKERYPLYQMPIPELCPQSNVPLHYLDILSATCALLTIVIGIKILYDYFWQKKTGKLPYFFKVNC